MRRSRYEEVRMSRSSEKSVYLLVSPEHRTACMQGSRQPSPRMTEVVPEQGVACREQGTRHRLPRPAVAGTVRPSRGKTVAPPASGVHRKRSRVAARSPTCGMDWSAGHHASEKPQSQNVCDQ